MEQNMFFQRDGQPGTHPVAHDRDEILEDVKQMVAPRDGADELDQRDDHAPRPARNRLGIPAQDLAGQRSRVGTGRVVGDHADGQAENAEAAEAAETVIAGEEERTG